MPLIDIRTEAHEVVVGVWKITECADELISALPAHEAIDLGTQISNTQKLTETLAGRVLVKHLLARAGKEYVGLLKTPEKAPYFPHLAYRVSISHTAQYAVANIHPTDAVGIDVEQARSQMWRIASRIMSAEELDFVQDDLPTLALLWCAKETLYKIHQKKGLDFRYDMLILPFEIAEEGTFRGCLFPHEPHPYLFDFYYKRLDETHFYTWASRVLA